MFNVCSYNQVETTKKESKKFVAKSGRKIKLSIVSVYIMSRCLSKIILHRDAELYFNNLKLAFIITNRSKLFSSY